MAVKLTFDTSNNKHQTSNIKHQFLHATAVTPGPPIHQASVPRRLVRKFVTRMRKERIIFEGTKSFPESSHKLQISITEHLRYGVLEVSAYEANYDAQALLLYIDDALLRSMLVTYIVQRDPNIHYSSVSSQESDEKRIGYLLSKIYVNSRSWDGTTSLVSVQFDDSDDDDAELLVDCPEGMVSDQKWITRGRVESQWNATRCGNKSTWCHSDSVIGALIHHHAFLDVWKPMHSADVNDTMNMQDDQDSEMDVAEMGKELQDRPVVVAVPIANVLAWAIGKLFSKQQITESSCKTIPLQPLRQCDITHRSPHSVALNGVSEDRFIEHSRAQAALLSDSFRHHEVAPLAAKLQEMQLRTSVQIRTGPFFVLVKRILGGKQNKEKLKNIELEKDKETERAYSSMGYKPSMPSVSAQSFRRRLLGEFYLGSQRVSPGR